MKSSRSFHLPKALCLLLGLPLLASSKVLRSDVLNIKDINSVNDLSELSVKVLPEAENVGKVYLVLSDNEDSLIAKPENLVQKGDTVCAHGKFEDSIRNIGWDQIYVETDGSCGRLVSLYSAGWVEGYLSSKQIEQYHHNFMIMNAGDKNELERGKPIFEEIFQNTIDNIDRRKHSKDTTDKTFWSGLELFSAQFEGVYAGAKAKKGSKQLEKGDLLLLNSNGEVSDLLEVFKAYSHSGHTGGLFLQGQTKKTKRGFNKRQNNKDNAILENLYAEFGTKDLHEIWIQKLLKSHCSAFIKLVKDDNDLVKDVMVAHGTWDYFEGMLKVMKKYHFQVSAVEGGPVTDYKIIFPSYPGSITSQDDFYVRENGLIVTETTLNTFDTSLFEKHFDAKIFMPTFLKLASANFLGNTAEKWVKYFSHIKTVSYNSEWMIVDVNNLEKSVHQKKLIPKTFYVLEQIPGTVIARDMTGHLNKKTYWSSYNVPLFDETYKKAGYESICRHGDCSEFNRAQNQRQLIFDKYADQVTDIENLKELIRLNKENDPGLLADFSSVQGDQIAPRYDVDSGSLFGETDAKITNLKLAKETSLIAISGPVKIGGSAFSFSNSKYNNLKGMPKKWNFGWETYGF